MKSRIFKWAILLMFCFGIGSPHAEEFENKMFYVLEIAINPLKVSDYERAQKIFLSESAKHDYSFPYTVFSTDDFHYYFITPIKDMNDLNNMFKAYETFIKKMGREKYQDVMKNFAGTFEYMTEGVSVIRDDLSYVPENPRIKPDERNFINWNYWHVKAGMEQEISNVWKAYISLYKKNNIKDDWAIWAGGFGSDNPYFVSVFYGKSEGDFYDRKLELNKMMCQEMGELWTKALSMCRKYEYKHGKPRPDLSYSPKTELIQMGRPSAIMTSQVDINAGISSLSNAR